MAASTTSAEAAADRIEGATIARKNKEHERDMKYFFALLPGIADAVLRFTSTYVSAARPPNAIEITDSAAIDAISLGTNDRSFRIGTTRSRRRVDVTAAKR